MVGPATYFDPSHAGDLDPATRDLVERRTRVLGSAYRLFYDNPVQLVRGSGTKVYDINGVEYLDAYNNVPSVGHAHPRVTAAMTKQAGLLTTHTRYLSEGIVAYAEDLLGTLPASIDNIMFTCTGSEANDLALRIAKLVTGGTGVIVTSNAYHGVTTEVAAISPSLGGITSLPDWVRVVDVDDLAEGVPAALAELGAPAALIVDTVFASDGVFPDAPGLTSAIDAVRSSGGLFIADEVQPGFGRLGHGMWGFERYGIVPDMVTVGKPMGNGQPIAAVMAPHALIDSFNEHSRYFNTFGGSSVSIAAAQATLDVLRDEQLIENARHVGAYLLEELRGLPFVDVRGAGLFIGAQLETSDRAVAAVNALRERRVLLSASGARNDTLKIRPPLPFSRADADRLLTELEAVLSPSNLEKDPVEEVSTASSGDGVTVLQPRDVPLGGPRAMTVRRTLPQRSRSLIGAWCFIDHYGPDVVEDKGGMVVPPHPHTGLQTVSWLFAGEIEHRDSVGSRAPVRPGELNLMTAGSGIAHSEVSTPATTVLHGAQLWVALPDSARHGSPAFESYVPQPFTHGAATVRVFIGELAGVASTATVFTRLLGAQVDLPAGGRVTFEVDEGFEHGVLVDAGDVTVGGHPVPVSHLAYVPAGRTTLTIATGAEPARVMLLGGEPLGERIVMWWNFIGRSHQEIVEYRDAWQHEVIEGGDPHGRFGTVDYDGRALPAPELPNVRLSPRG